MKEFRVPPSTWLGESALNILKQRYATAWKSVEGDGSGQGLETYLAAQNDGMLLKFFLEQLTAEAGTGPKTTRLIERDFGGRVRFTDLWIEHASRPDVEWLVFGLSFADFKFHIFPILAHSPAAPFCVSPAMCGCFCGEVVASTKLTRNQFAHEQLEHMGWDAVEQRIDCLEQPLDVFGEPTECSDGECAIYEP